MLRISTRDFEQNVLKYLVTARIEPVCIARENGSALVVLAYEEMEQLVLLEAAYWAASAQLVAARQEFVSNDEAMRFLNELLSNRT